MSSGVRPSRWFPTGVDQHRGDLPASAPRESGCRKLDVSIRTPATGLAASRVNMGRRAMEDMRGPVGKLSSERQRANGHI